MFLPLEQVNSYSESKKSDAGKKILNFYRRYKERQLFRKKVWDGSEECIVVPSDLFYQTHSREDSLFLPVSKTILVKIKHNSRTAEEDIKRLINLFKFPHMKFVYRFRPNGIGILSSHGKLMELIPVRESIQNLANIKYDPFFNTSQLVKLVEEADKLSNGLFRKASRLLSYWNYKLLESKKLSEKPFKSMELLILSLNWFYSEQSRSSKLGEFITEIFHYSLKHIEEPIELIHRDKTIKKLAEIKGPESKKFLEEAILLISSGNWANLIPGIKNEEQLERLSDEIVVNPDYVRIEKITTWLSQKLFSVMKRVAISGSTARGTALKGYSDIDFLLILKDDEKMECSKEIESTLKKIFSLLGSESKIHLQKHSIGIETSDGSFDLAIAKEIHDDLHPGSHIFEVSYEY